MTLDLEILFDHWGNRFCGHFKNNLTESRRVVKWKTHSTLLSLRCRRTRVGVNWGNCEIRIESTVVGEKNLYPDVALKRQLGVLPNLYQTV